jgi:hypothetical protein
MLGSHLQHNFWHSIVHTEHTDRISVWVNKSIKSEINATLYFFPFGATAPQWARTLSFTKFLYHTQRRTTVGRTPLEEWQHPTLTKHIQIPGGIRTRNLSRGAAVNLRLRPAFHCKWKFVLRRHWYNLTLKMKQRNSKHSNSGSIVRIRTRRTEIFLLNHDTHYWQHPDIDDTVFLW